MAQEDTQQAGGRRYRAFISYSQTDKPMARRLQRWLEVFRAPKELGGAKIGRIFRDEDDLSGAPDLGDALKANIEASDALIVLCSPRAAQSRWVDREIQHFRATGRGGQIFALIVEGAPKSADPATECFPPSFRALEDVEPLAVDLQVDGRDRAFTRLAAGLLTVPFDALWQRERRRQNARLAAAGGLTAAGLGLLAIAGVGLWFAGVGQAGVSKGRSDLIATQAGQLYEEGLYEIATLMALQSDPAAQGSWIARFFNGRDGYPDARARLMAAHEANRLERILGDPASAVTSAAFSPDGAHVVTASQDGNARIWEVDSRALLLTLRGHQGALFSAAFSPDGARVVTASEDGTARVWDARSGASLLRLSGHEDEVASAAFSPDGTRIVTASWDGTARVWAASDGAPLLTLSGHEGAVASAAFSPDGARIVTGSRDGTARVWDARSGVSLLSLSGHEDEVASAAFSPDGSRIVTASWDGTARVWDARSGVALLTLSDQGEVYSACFSADGTRIVTASEDGAARVWDASDGALLLVLNVHRRERLNAHRVYSARFSPDGAHVVTVSEDGAARVWNVAPAAPLLTLPGGLAASFSPDGSRIAVSGAGLGVWDAMSGEALLTIPRSHEWIRSIAFSPDSARLVTGSTDGAVSIWDAQSGAELSSLVGHEEMVRSATFSLDGARILTASRDGKAIIWDANSGAPSLTIAGDGSELYSASFSPDGAHALIATQTGDAQIWNAQNGALVRALTGHETPTYFALFFPDGQRVVTVSEDGTARIWNADTGALVINLSLSGRRDPINAVALSADGVYVLTGAGDGLVRISDARVGSPILTLRAHRYLVSSASFSQDGSRFVTVGMEATHVWGVPEMLRASAREQARIACERLARIGAPLSFTAAEAARYPALANKPRDPETGDLLSPCRGLLADAVIAENAAIWSARGARE